MTLVTMFTARWKGNATFIDKKRGREKDKRVSVFFLMNDLLKYLICTTKTNIFKNSNKDIRYQIDEPIL